MAVEPRHSRLPTPSRKPHRPLPPVMNCQSFLEPFMVIRISPSLRARPRLPGKMPLRLPTVTAQQLRLAKLSLRRQFRSLTFKEGCQVPEAKWAIRCLSPLRQVLQATWSRAVSEASVIRTSQWLRAVPGPMRRMPFPLPTAIAWHLMFPP